MKIKNFLSFIILVLLGACGGLDDAAKVLKNEKTRTTDEFLIEKRGPLSLPPKMGELPKPKSNEEIKKDKKNILGSINQDAGPKEKSEIENIFLEEIRKN